MDTDEGRPVRDNQAMSPHGFHAEGDGAAKAVENRQLLYTNSGEFDPGSG